MTGIVQVPLDIMCRTKDGTGTFDKACKIGTSSIGAVDSMAKAISGSSSAFVPLTKLADQMKIFSGLVGGLNILSRMQEIVCKNPKINDYVWKAWKAKNGNIPYAWMRPDWTPKGVTLTADEKKEAKRKYDANQIQDQGYWSGTKVAGQAMLTVAHTIGAVEFFKTIGLYSLGAAAPFLSLTKNVLYIPSSALGLADAAHKIHMSKVYTKNCENKQRKWENRTSMSLDSLNEKYVQKINRAEAKINALELRERLPKLKSQERKAIQVFNNHLKNKIAQWQNYIREFSVIERVGSDESQKTEFLQVHSQLAKDCDRKISDWTKIVKVAKSNQKIETTKNAISIAYQVLKITFGIIGVTLATLAILASFGVMSPIAPLALTIMAVITGFGWAVTESVGLSKEIYGFFRNSKKIDKPHLQYQPPVDTTTQDQTDPAENSEEESVEDLSAESSKDEDPIAPVEPRADEGAAADAKAAKVPGDDESSIDPSDEASLQEEVSNELSEEAEDTAETKKESSVEAPADEPKTEKKKPGKFKKTRLSKNDVKRQKQAQKLAEQRSQSSASA